MKNPIAELIEQTELTAKLFAIFYRCPMSSLRNCMYGYSDTVPQKVKLALKRAGFCIDDIDERYTDWLRNQALKEMEDIKNESRK